MIAARTLVIEHTNRWSVSQHQISGIWQWQVVLFVIAFVIAATACILLLGYGLLRGLRVHRRIQDALTVAGAPAPAEEFDLGEFRHGSAQGGDERGQIGEQRHARRWPGSGRGTVHKAGPDGRARVSRSLKGGGPKYR